MRPLPQVSQHISTLRGTQVGLPAALPSVTEIAAVVNPGDIPASRIGVGYSTGANKRTRKPVHLTSRMPDDTTDGASIPGPVTSTENAATAAKQGKRPNIERRVRE